VEFGSTIDRALVDAVTQMREHVNALHEQGKLIGLRETVPTFRSLAIVFDPLLTSASSVQQTLEENPVLASASVRTRGHRWRLPVCYGDSFGPDLEEVATRTNLSVNEVIDAHLDTRYQVYLLGFQPGYGFLGDTDKRLHLPRRSEPRVRIPAGSVAIAMKLTCVYPWDSPGGWHLLGQCPIPMFNAEADRPTLLSPNDEVRFEAIDAATFRTLDNDRQAGNINWSNWLDERE